MSRLLRRIHYLLNRKRLERELAEEMSVHREMLTEERRGSVPTALDYYNHVLALDEGNARVLASVQRLGRRNAMRRFVLRGVLACAVLATAAGGVWLAAGERGAFGKVM